MSRIKIKNYYRLTEPQKRIYISESLNPGTSISNLCASYYLEEPGDPTLLSEAINQVIQRNDGLRLQIAIIEGVAFQYIEPYQKHDFEIQEVQDHEKWKKEFSMKSFELLDSRLFNIALFYDKYGGLSFIINIHHIISDAWTHDSLAKQVLSIYKSLLKFETIVFEKPGSYLEYVYDEEQYLNSSRFEKSQSYWNELFNNEKIGSILESNDSKSKESLRHDFFYSNEESKRITDFCIKHKVSAPNFFLSVLCLSLKYYTSEDNFVIGTLIHNRLGKKEKKVTGMFVNTLPILCEVNRDDNFFNLVKDIGLKMTGVIRNQRFPLNRIKNLPELEVVYTYENIEFPVKHELHFAGYEFFPMVFRASNRGEDNRYKLEIDYHTCRFDISDIKAFLKYYNKILGLILNSPDKELKFLENKEYKTVGEFYSFVNNTTANYNLDNTLHGIFEKSVELFGEKKAISFNNSSLTYNELNRRANHLGKKILELGGGNQSPVVLIMDRSLEMMISILAVLKSGSCYLPLSPEQPLLRSEKVISLSGASIVLYNSDAGEKLNVEVNSVDVRKLSYPESCINNLNINVNSRDLAYIIYTSGSTGEPKGVMLEHKAVLNRLFWMQKEYPISSSDVLLQKTPYTFDVSVWELFWWYFNGSSLHFLKPGEEKEPEAIVNAINSNNITNIHFVPSMLTLFLEYIERVGSIERVKILNRIICSGEALQVKYVNHFNELLTSINKTTIHNLYGPTEAAIDVSFFNCTGDEKNFVPIGKPIDNVELYVLNESGELLPPGQAGELYIGGVCLARGYFNRPDLTEEKFKVNNILNKRLYSTGDLATFLEDGNIKYLGRIDNQVKIRGNRVELGEIESHLLKYPGISEVAIIAPVDESGSAYLGAYYVSGEELSHEDLRHYIQKDLPSYMIPSYFMRIDSFPLTSSGKLDRKALPQPQSRSSVGKVYHAPINDREEEICEIWEDVLKIEKIGRNDNFFDLGGDSLSLIKVHFSLHQKYDVTLQDLFEFQTIESLCQHIHLRNQNILGYQDEEYCSVINSWNYSEKMKRYYSESNVKDLERIEYKNLLITGSTGFLGIYIVKEFLESSDSNLFLLVRAANSEAGMERVKAKFSFYFGADYISKHIHRIKIVTGDVSSPKLGIDDYDNLANTVDGVVHCAANVKHYGDRQEVNKINVEGTRSIIEFCETGINSRLIFISTMSIGLNKVVSGDSFNFIEDDIIKVEEKGNVYLDSKILAEELVRESSDKLSWQIIRAGNIVNDSKTGKFQENSDDNAFCSIMREYKHRGDAPDIDIPFIDLSFVNESAEAVRILASITRSGTYHLFNPNNLTLRQVCECANIEMVSLKDFMDNILYGDPVLVHGYYLKNINALGMVPYCDLTMNILRELEFSWSQINKDLLEKLWSSWIDEKNFSSN